MVVDMELQETKNYVLQLMKDKDDIEAEIKALKEILDSNHVGMDESLVDSEGYPRQDIDVYQVRHARHKIICSRNDHKTLMKKIEEGLHKIHALAGNRADSSEPVEENDVEQAVQLEPFLRVNLVSPDSPAEIAGIEVDDLILEFGSIDYRNFKSLRDIGALVQNILNLIPRPWAGNGLLGCNVIPLETVER